MSLHGAHMRTHGIIRQEHEPCTDAESRQRCTPTPIRSRSDSPSQVPIPCIALFPVAKKRAQLKRPLCWHRPGHGRQGTAGVVSACGVLP